MNNEDFFKARMVEQVCQIENYKYQLEQQGRCVSLDEAAMEWISLYAHSFPAPDAFKKSFQVNH